MGAAQRQKRASGLGRSVVFKSIHQRRPEKIIRQRNVFESLFRAKNRAGAHRWRGGAVRFSRRRRGGGDDDQFAKIGGWKSDRFGLLEAMLPGSSRAF